MARLLNKLLFFEIGIMKPPIFPIAFLELFIDFFGINVSHSIFTGYKMSVKVV